MSALSPKNAAASPASCAIRFMPSDMFAERNTGTRVEACFMCLRSCSPKPVVHSTSGSDCFMQ